MKIALLTVLLFSVVAGAGVQGVGKGGGYGEMQAYSANLNMDRLVQGCISNGPACGLNQAEFSTVQDASSRTFSLTLDPSCGVQGVEVLTSRQARISSCDLYVLVGGTPQVKAFAAIARLVLQARLMAVASLGSITADELAAKVFGNSQQTSSSSSVDLAPGVFLFNVMQLSQAAGTRSVGSVVQTLFAIEGKTTTHEITDEVLVALGCGASQVEKVISTTLQANDESSALATSKIAWACANGELRQGELLVAFGTKNDGEVDVNSLSVRVVGVFAHR